MVDFGVIAGTAFGMEASIAFLMNEMAFRIEGGCFEVRPLGEVYGFGVELAKGYPPHITLYTLRYLISTGVLLLVFSQGTIVGFACEVV